MQLVKQINIDTTLRQIIADPDVGPSKTIEGFLIMTGSNFTRMAAQLDIHPVHLSRILNGHLSEPENLRKHHQNIADCLGWPVELLWPENGNGTAK